jgi:hypothetical protein
MSVAAAKTVTVALIACTKKKRKDPTGTRAEDLYLGERFLLAKEYAKKRGWSIMILSAEHGLLPPKKYISWYDASLADKTPEQIAKWAKAIDGAIFNLKCARQMSRRIYKFVVLAEDLYALPLKEVGIEAHYPLLGMNEEQQKEFLRDTQTAE